MALQPVPLDFNGLFQRSSYIRRRSYKVSAGVCRLPHVFFSRGTQLILDALLCGTSLILSYSLRFDFTIPRQQWHIILFWLVLLPIMRISILSSLGIYRRIWRYFNLDDAVVFTCCNILPSVFLLALRRSPLHTMDMFRIPFSIIVCEFGAFVLFSLSARLLRRVTFAVSGTSVSDYTRVLLVGSDTSLASVAQRIRTSGEVSLLGLLVYDRNLQGLSLGGFPILGEIDSLPAVLSQDGCRCCLDCGRGPCLHRQDRCNMRRFLELTCELFPARSSIIRGDMRFVRDRNSESALEQKVVEDPDPIVVEAFRERVVLITGAGGSIGSELTRQVARLPVSTMILLDQDENSIFELKNALVNSKTQITVISVVGDVRDHNQLKRLFVRNRPAVVLHAAAYKHVPVLEENCCEAVLNNVLGTRELAELAADFRAERFLMVSTDKAVRPSSVMGATKRVAELVVQALSANGNATRCACVRFGNVLGSRGSVVPIFLQQIAKGGPVTITDENMTRYFMTIPDAAKLVLEASTLGSRGDIYMLDMGDPVKITALAEQLIKGCGFAFRELTFEFNSLGRAQARNCTNSSGRRTQQLVPQNSRKSSEFWHNRHLTSSLWILPP